LLLLSVIAALLVVSIQPPAMMKAPAPIAEALFIANSPAFNVVPPVSRLSSCFH
jgi:hypothetical protein